MPEIGPFFIDGKSYLTLQHASRIIGLSCATLHYWGRRGHTPWELDLDIVRQPVLKHAHYRTGTKRDFRFLISQESTFLVKRLLDHYRPNPHRPRRFTNQEIADLKAATWHFLPR